jgi:lysozyme
MAKWKWCLEDDSGALLKGWQNVKGIWYYLNSNGTMTIGWIKDKDKWYYLDSNGAMKIGWLKYNNKWYYLGSTGAMYSSCTSTLDGKFYTFGADGAWIENNYLVSDALVNFIKAFEGFSATAYNDGTGVMTIGYGTVNRVYVALGHITEAQATQFLKEEINEKAKQVKANLNSHGIALNQNQFDALVSFAYNCGLGALFGSILYRRILNGARDSSLKANFITWSKAGGRTIQGLLNRRIEEYNMFVNGDYTRNL